MNEPTVELEQLRVWSEALENAQLQLAKRERDLRNLQSEYQSLRDQFASEHARAERLAALVDRIGVR